jgi:SAM-dependent methyltransferase
MKVKRADRREDFARLPFRCPTCQKALTVRRDELVCSSCGGSVSINDDSARFVDTASEFATDPLDRIKAVVKRHYRLYDLLIELLSPVFPLHRIRFRRQIRRMIAEGGVVANIGAGNTIIAPGIVNVDFLPYPNVDAVASAEDLPFLDDSIDGLVSISVLEHLRDPDKALSEMLRVLKPGGILLLFVPFMVGFHASPDDFNRFTSEGLRLKLKGFQIESMWSPGPTSALLWIFQEWVAALLSFGSSRVNRLVHIIVMLLTWPIKFLDVFMRLMPGADHIAVGYAVVARKPLR